MTNTDQCLSPDTQVLHISHWPIKIIAWLSILFFSFCAFMAWMSNQGSVSPFFLIFVVIGILLVLMYGRTEVDQFAIHHIAPLGHYQIAWAEITQIETDPQGGGMVFQGMQKRLVIPGVAFWSGKHRRLFLERFDAEVKQRSLPVKQNPWAAYKFSKHTKVDSAAK